MLFLLLMVACNTEQPKPKSTVTPKTEDTVEANKQKIKSPTIWHSPSTLTERLGDLSDKTVANIGAGPYGYFSIEIADEAKKVIAIDIDPKAIRFIDSMRLQILPLAIQDNLETRLVEPDNPKLRFEEADVVTIRETYAYLPNRIQYLKTLKRYKRWWEIVDCRFQNAEITSRATTIRKSTAFSSRARFGKGWLSSSIGR